MWSGDSSIESARSRIGLKFSSRVISDSNMFIAMLRVEMVDEVIWSRLLMLASWPNTKSPPTCGHLNVAAAAPEATNASPASAVTALSIPRPITEPLPSLWPNQPLARQPDGPVRGASRECPAASIGTLSPPPLAGLGHEEDQGWGEGGGRRSVRNRHGLHRHRPDGHSPPDLFRSCSAR